MRLIFLSLILFTAACSTKPKMRICLSDRRGATEYQLRAAEKTIAAMPGNNDKEVPAKMIHNTCHRITYLKGSYKISIYEDPNDDKYQRYVQMTHIKNMDLSESQCLERALEDLSNLQQLFIESILKEHQKKYAWKWQDAEVGPLQWLDCGKSKNVAYFDSLATFIHEINHEIREKNCLFSATDQMMTCFKFEKNLPPRSLAALEKIKSSNPKHQKFLTELQDLYMVRLNQPLTGLLEEYNSYLLSLKVYSALAEKYSALTLSAKKPSERPVILYPLFELYVLRYFIQLKKSDLSLFEKTMNESNFKKYLQKSLSHGRQAYEKWLQQLESEKMKPYDFESNFWLESNQLRQELNLP